jgi:hypothetical protein
MLLQALFYHNHEIQKTEMIYLEEDIPKNSLKEPLEIGKVQWQDFK